MSPSAARWAFSAFSALAFSASGQVTHSTRSGLRITDLSFSPGVWSHGTIEHRFVIENPTTERRSVTVEIPYARYSGSRDEFDSLSGSVAVEAGGRAALTLVQPPIGIRGDSRFAVSEPGRKPEEFSCVARDFRAYISEETVNVLLTRQLSAEAVQERVKACSASEEGAAPRRMRTPAGKRSSPVVFPKVDGTRLEQAFATWPEQWLAYAGYDGCLIGAEDYRSMPEGVRDAFRAYVAAGGTVTFLGVPKIPEGWEHTGMDKNREPLSEDEGAVPYGFGFVQAVSAQTPGSLTSNQVAALVERWKAVQAPWSGCVAPVYRYSGNVAEHFESCLTDIPVAGNESVPIKRFLAILLLFVLLVGPGAVIYVARKDCRLRLLVIVPAISLAFSAVIVVVAISAEGVTPYVRRQSVTLLDQPRRQAATLGAVSVYAPVSVGRPLAFDGGTEVTPLRYDANSNFRSIVDAGDQLFANGWVRPRMASFFRVRRSETRTERLVVETAPDGAVAVVNALGAPIRRLALNDGTRTYVAENVASGERKLLIERESTEDKRAAITEVRKLIASQRPGWNLPETLKKALPQPGPRGYVAVLDGCPFLENPLKGGRTKRSEEAMVVGFY